ncbi:ABC transporter C family member 3-like protein [Tanacetum coccineum]
MPDRYQFINGLFWLAYPEGLGTKLPVVSPNPVGRIDPACLKVAHPDAADAAPVAKQLIKIMFIQPYINMPDRYQFINGLFWLAYPEGLGTKLPVVNPKIDPVGSPKIDPVVNPRIELDAVVVVNPRIEPVEVAEDISLDRIATFLHLDDVDSNAIIQAPQGSSETAIEIINGKRGIVVCELSKVSGSVKVEGTKAYVAQSPWIQSGMIEDNILFGREMDGERYEKVLEACSLNKHLEILSFGDQTAIGERGINLSGGQKHIQIVRALYQQQQQHHYPIRLFIKMLIFISLMIRLVLLMLIQEECMLQFLDSKTVIYITHQVEFLPAADLILVLRDGRITQAGKYNDILDSGSDFMELVGAHKEALSSIDSIGTTVDQSIKMHLSISRSPMSFFVSIPSGRILNRALDKCQLGDEVRSKEGKLKSPGRSCSYEMVLVLEQGLIEEYDSNKVAGR